MTDLELASQSVSQSYTTELFCEYIALFMWVEKAACSKTLIRDKGLNRGTCAWTTENIVISKFESPAKVEY